jgi:hypothetical protein
VAVTNKMADEQFDVSDEEHEIENDYEELIRYYFYKGFTYEVIRQFLSEYHNKEMSLSTLKRHIRDLGLRRRNAEYDIDLVKNAIVSLLEGPDCSRGYRSIWHTLQMNGIRVPRLVVEMLLREIDPEGVSERRRHRLRRRIYRNLGPNYAWHCDGYDKLKPFGFPIHGCIDGWSRKIIWLYVTRSNNLPSNIAKYYLEAVTACNGCPIDLVTDLGTENGIMAGIHSFFRNDPNSHSYVPSPRNQRIEGWWSFLRKNQTSWWIDFFTDLTTAGIVNLTDPLEKECLWFSFAGLLQKHLNETCEHWNTHYIRKSRHDTISGRPSALYYLPSSFGGMSNLLLPVPEVHMDYASRHLVEMREENYYQEYFKYVMENTQCDFPANWQEALRLYQLLINYARNGHQV